MNRLLHTLIPIFLLFVGSALAQTINTNDFVWYQKPASGPYTLVPFAPINNGIAGFNGTGVPTPFASSASVKTWLGTPTSANLATAVSDETGSGALVLANSPTLVSPALGTPSSLTLTNATGLPAAGVIGTAATLNNANTFTRLQTITQGTANEGILSSTGYSLTGSSSQSAISIAGTLNTSGSPTCLSFAFTRTAAGADTKYLSILGGSAGTTELLGLYENNSTIAGSGALVLGGGTSNRAIKLVADTSVSFQLRTSDDVTPFMTFVTNAGGGGGKAVFVDSGVIGLCVGGFSFGATNDLFLVRDAARTFALRDGSNANALRVYNTYTDGTTFERIDMKWVSNVAFIGTSKGSVGGSVREVGFGVNDTASIIVKSTGEVELASGARVLSGFGTPEGSVSAVVGSFYLRRDGGANTTLYIKESGSGNTGWVAK